MYPILEVENFCRARQSESNVLFVLGFCIAIIVSAGAALAGYYLGHVPLSFTVILGFGLFILSFSGFLFNYQTLRILKWSSLHRKTLQSK